MLDGDSLDTFFSGIGFLYIEAKTRQYQPTQAEPKQPPSDENLGCKMPLQRLNPKAFDNLERQVEQSVFASLYTTKIPTIWPIWWYVGYGSVQSGSGMCSGGTIWPDRPWWDVVLSKFTGIQSPVYLYTSSYRFSICVVGQLQVSHC